MVMTVCPTRGPVTQTAVPCQQLLLQKLLSRGGFGSYMIAQPTGLFTLPVASSAIPTGGRQGHNHHPLKGMSDQNVKLPKYKLINKLEHQPKSGNFISFTQIDICIFLFGCGGHFGKSNNRKSCHIGCHLSIGSSETEKPIKW